MSETSILFVRKTIISKLEEMVLLTFNPIKLAIKNEEDKDFVNGSIIDRKYLDNQFSAGPSFSSARLSYHRLSNACGPVECPQMYNLKKKK